jgi:hypothetical protein
MTLPMVSAAQIPEKYLVQLIIIILARMHQQVLQMPVQLIDHP